MSAYRGHVRVLLETICGAGFVGYMSSLAEENKNDPCCCSINRWEPDARTNKLSWAESQKPNRTRVESALRISNPILAM